MKFSKRQAVTDDLSKYCILTNKDETIEVIEWNNGEGYDISFLKDGDSKSISLTSGEIDALFHLTKSLEYRELDEEEDEQ